ncbi:methyltransferase domain-containing protein [Saccharopolyspora aridisoli]|uniref:Methyltransferase domain-containing protein n=1 Tax=Saccharopolyspora aridisoli TaxID=2530385 RepID=A0A4R4UXV6_9PSEU|nr:methyltransferase domain-containing protein [Saccharopolyspora aridisoli]TDC93663.1 methyltransferase domain-containing protein [Saccharopolyspora aridisoli]
MGAQDTYTHGHHESVLRSPQWRTAENSAPHLLGDLRPGVQVLDVGCGPGTITLDFAERVAPGQVLGIDNVEEPLAISRTAAAERGVDNARFEVADVYRLPHADDSFDVVHAHQVLQHLTDPVAALREMRRVCKPGGVVAARDADYGGMRWSPDHPGLDRWLELYRAVARSNHAYPDGGKLLKTWALEAGFTDVECTASAWCFATPEERAWWGDLWADRIRQSSFAHQAIAHGLTTQDELESLAQAWHAWRDADTGWFAVLNGEVRCRT